MTPDVNVLVAASRSDHSYYRSARSWLDAAVVEASVGAEVLLFPMVVASFLRLAGHPKVFPVPMPATAAIAFVDSLLAAPGVKLPQLGDEWPRLRALCLGGKLKPYAVPDAWLAAAVQEAGDHLVTFDKGFRRLLKRSELTILLP